MMLVSPGRGIVGAGERERVYTFPATLQDAGAARTSPGRSHKRVLVIGDAEAEVQEEAEREPLEGGGLRAGGGFPRKLLPPSSARARARPWGATAGRRPGRRLLGPAHPLRTPSGRWYVVPPLISAVPPSVAAAIGVGPACARDDNPVWELQRAWVPPSRRPIRQVQAREEGQPCSSDPLHSQQRPEDRNGAS